MEYTVKQSDLIGEIKRFPIEVVQKMVDRALEQHNDLEWVLSTLQTDPIAAFCWQWAPEGNSFWRGIVVGKRWDSFFKRYPELFGNQARYAIVKSGCCGMPECIWRYAAEDNGLADNGREGDVYFVEQVDGIIRVRFALRDSKRYKRVVKDGINIGY